MAKLSDIEWVSYYTYLESFDADTGWAVSVTKFSDDHLVEIAESSGDLSLSLKTLGAVQDYLNAYMNENGGCLILDPTSTFDCLSELAD